MGGVSVSRLRFIVVFLLGFAVWWGGGLVLHRHVLDHNNGLQLDALSEQLVRRAEKALDYVVIAQTELLLSGHSACAPATSLALRQMAINTGTVSNIHMIGPGATCSSFDDVGAPLPSAVERQSWTAARNAAFRVGSMENRDANLIGVSWGFGTGLELVMAINADTLLFDVLPQELRNDSRVSLSITDDALLASYPAGEAAARVSAIASDWVAFAAEGTRYPLRAEISVAPTALSAWRRDVSNPVQSVWAVAGLFIAAFFAWASGRRRNPELEAVQVALRNGEIVPYFQPIVDIRSGRTIGCEALARWIKPDGAIVSPGHFIPLVERHGLDDRLLARLLENAGESLKPVLDTRPDFYASFNVTPDQISTPDFANRMNALSIRHGLDPTQVCVEVTERKIMASPEHAAKNIADLRAAGFRVAIDDAGTGHNGLAAIQLLKANTIKIDKFFVDHVHQDQRSRVMVDMFVSVAARYGMKTVAEGVETEDQRKALRLAGVHAIQGYLHAPALPAKAFLETLENEAEPAIKTASTKANGQRKAVIEMVDNKAGRTGLQPSDTGDEAARLAALYRYQILDTAEEEAFDRVPRIVRSALNAPMAAIAFIDDDRRWFKAVAGGKRGELPRSHSFCNHTIQRPEPTVVGDTHNDERFQENPLVVDAPHIRAYLGVPLETPEGYRIGSVCCVDKKPRAFNDEEISLVKDLSSIVVEQLELRKLALFDPLTAVRSRRGFRSEAELQLALAAVDGATSSILMLDVDHFKRINDRFGHTVGDEVLTGVCERMSGVLDERHILGRMGGEEFAIALPRTHLADALEIAEDIRAIVSMDAFQTSGGAIPVHVSIGAASTVAKSDDLDLLLRHSDEALYRAKADGRNRVCEFTRKAA
ncbi:MAG: EAL domain-containing protein [Pseudomonadota bacterium]